MARTITGSKLFLPRGMKHPGDSGIVSFLSYPRYWMETISQLHVQTPLYPKRTFPQYSLNRSIGGPRTGVSVAEEEMSLASILPVPGLESRLLCHPASSLFSISNEVSQLISKNCSKILVGTPEEKIPHGISKCRWEDDIKV